MIIEKILPVVLVTSLQAESVLKPSVEGGVRIGIQYHDSGDFIGKDVALGGDFHLQSKTYKGLHAAVGIYTSQILFNQNDADGVAFFSNENNAYTILNEAYLTYAYKNTTLTAGRQILDTPFLDSDDIGMVPNYFEAYSLVNQDLRDVMVFYAYVQSMSGVDAPVVERFTEINGGSGVHILGADYAGIEHLSISGWAYIMPHFAQYIYTEAAYENSMGRYHYDCGLQFAWQDFAASSSAKVYGLQGNISDTESGLRLLVAYNRSMDAAADNGFGGGPYFTSGQHMTLAENGIDGSVLSYGVDWDSSEFVYPGLTFSLLKTLLDDRAGHEGDELDVTASLAYSQKLSFDAIYSKIENQYISGDKFDNARVYVNYRF